MNNTVTDNEIVREAMRILGSRTSPKKKISSRLNAMKPRKKRKKEVKGKKVKNLADASNPDKRIKRKAKAAA